MTNTKNIQSMNQRDKTIDIAKGIGIILVAYGHTSSQYPLHASIYNFHMPLFFLLFGIFFFDAPLKDFLYKRFRTLFVPFVFFYCLALILKAIYFYIFRSPQDVINMIQNGEFFNISIVNQALWFLACLMTAAFIYYCILHFITKIKIRWSVIAIFFLIGYTLAYFKIVTPFYFSQACLIIPFIALGGSIYKNVSKQNNIILFITSAILFIISQIIQTTTTNIGDLEIDKTVILYFIPAITGCIMIISISRFLSHFKYATILATLGEMSLFIFALHCCLGFIKWTYSWLEDGICKGIIQTIIVVTVSYYLGVWLKKYFPYLFSYK